MTRYLLLIAALLGGEPALAQDAATLRAIRECKDKCAASYNSDSPDRAACTDGCDALATACAEDASARPCADASNLCADPNWAAIHTEECPASVTGVPGATQPAPQGGNTCSVAGKCAGPVGGGGNTPTPPSPTCSMGECPNSVGDLQDPATQPAPDFSPTPYPAPDFSPPPDFSQPAMPDFSPSGSD